MTPSLLPLRSALAAIALIAAAAPDAMAQADVEYEDNSAIRENPIIEDTGDELSITIPSYIKSSANRIILNGADWSGIHNAIRHTSRDPFSIVHIGDSHLQADYATSLTRDLLQYDYGDAGRGLVLPFKLSGTNQPHDYVFSSPSSWRAAKVMKRPWSQTMGFTGQSVRPVGHSGTLIIGTVGADDYDPFSSITLFHKGKLFIKGIHDEEGRAVSFTATPSADYTHIDMTDEITSATIQFESAGDLTLFGANLSGNRPGLFYHVIGNNGAAYDTYNTIGRIGAGIAPLHPDLVIISLGTNEAFGRPSATAFKASIKRLVDDIRTANPQAQVLLVTPMECQRSVYRNVSKRVAGKRRKNGKRAYRNVRSRVHNYAVNSNIATLRQAILDFGKENGIAVYDWYDVAGGAGASTKWIADRLYGKDRVHHTVKGYHLQGKLLYDALHKELSGNQH